MAFTVDLAALLGLIDQMEQFDNRHKIIAINFEQQRFRFERCLQQINLKI